MMDSLARGELLPQISLAHCPDGEFQVRDGHHRLLAFWLSGRRTLEIGQYRLTNESGGRRRYGKIEFLATFFC